MKWLLVVAATAGVVLFIWWRGAVPDSESNISNKGEHAAAKNVIASSPTGVEVRVVRTEQPERTSVEQTVFPSSSEAPKRELAAEDVRDYIKTEFLRQPRDTAWARTASHKVESHVLEFVSDRSRLEGIECRTSICEMRISHDSDDDYLAFLDKAFSRAAFHEWGGEYSSRELRPMARTERK